MLAAHDTETTNSHKAQGKLGEKVNRVRHDRYVTSLVRLPTDAHPQEEVDPFGESETRECAKARQRSQSGPGAAAWLRARPVDVQRVIPTQEFLHAWRRLLGIEEPLVLTFSACGAADSNTRHAQAGVHLHAGSADEDVSAASTSESR